MNCVYILGSGQSVLELTAEETVRINGADCSIALNRFAAFQHKAGIWPTHVYFVDYDDVFLQHIFDLYRQPGLMPRRATFILHKTRTKRLARTWNAVCWKKLVISLLRREYRSVFLSPGDCFYEFVQPTNWLDKSFVWGRSLDDPLLHYRGSLTTAINYAAVRFPGRTIKLIGVDLNRSDYFFQKELEELPFYNPKWSNQKAHTAGRHFTVMNHQGTNILDVIPFITKKLQDTGNSLVCCSPDSMLVLEGYVPYSDV